jgi:TIR domain
MEPPKPLPVFPFVPDKVTRQRLRVFVEGDFLSQDDVDELVQLLWEEPDTTFYYYCERDRPLEPQLLARVSTGVVRADDYERRYYRHPKHDRSYLRIAGTEDAVAEWQLELLRAGPEYWRTTLTLSPLARQQLDTRHKIALEAEIRESFEKTRYSFDAFLSYSSSNSTEADLVYSRAAAAGLRVFMAPKQLLPGDDFAEEIRCSLEGARELWLLLSPQSARSEWVISEWGAAWVLRRPIVPILHRCEPNLLPERISRFHCIDLHKIDELISSRKPRADA